MWWARFLNVVVLHNHKTWQHLRLDHQREWTFDEWWDASLSRVPVTLLESGLARDCFKTQAKTKNTSIRIQSSSKWAFEVRSYKFRLTNLVKKISHGAWAEFSEHGLVREYDVTSTKPALSSQCSVCSRKEDSSPHHLKVLSSYGCNVESAGYL